MIDIASIDAKTRSLLDRYGFNTIPLERLASGLSAGSGQADSFRISGSIDVAPEQRLLRLPETDSGEDIRLSSIGLDAIDSGKVGVIVLNGGMATRFGGSPKCVFPAVAGRSFLDLKLNQAVIAGHGRARIMLMNSFATDEATLSHLKEIDLVRPVETFNQMISLRLTSKGDLFIGKGGRPSPHTTGHGDLPFALKSSGILDRFIESGGRWLVVSNVDNLGAGLSPTVIGAHIDRGNPISVEVVRAKTGDVGGFPALVNGRLVIVESFRAPRSFDLSRIAVFNTNTFVFNAETFSADVDLDWFPVVKKVEGREAVQFERLVGQLTEFFDATWILVPREGPRSRFIPVKARSDLDTQISTLREVLEHEGVIERSV